VTALSTAAPREVPLSASREERFAQLVDSNRDRAVRLAWRLTGEDQATAEEVAQDAFLRAYTALDRFRDDAAMSTWFYRILVRQAANRRRWRGLRERWGGLWSGGPGRDSVDPSEVVPAPTAPASDPALRARIAAAMDQLSPGQRAVFTLVHLEGFTLREAAEITSVAPGTAKSHLHRALVSLRSTLEPTRQEVAP
jgi:RNA polymerase sigma-70 factor (ECF subfamily)